MGNKVTRTIDRKTLNIFVKLTRKKAKEEIIKRQERYGRKLTDEEKDRVIRKVARKTRGRVAVIGMFALGSVTGIEGTNLLDSASNEGINNNKTEIAIDAGEVEDKKISINNVTDDREIFINGLKVELNEIGDSESIESNVEAENSNSKSSENNIKKEVNNPKDLSKNIEEEINNLDTPEKILQYIKDMYVNEYNDNYNTNITTDDIRLEKIRRGVLYPDEAENGDKIVRKCEKKDYEGVGVPIQTNYGIINCFIQNDGVIDVESITNYDGSGKYVSVYSKDEKVEQNDETTLTQLGGIMDNGIDYYNVMLDKENNSSKIIDIYKQRLINSVIDYEQAEIDNEIEDNQQIDQTNEDLEIND